jgi:acetyl coenzyme A synthetase (ADP forming)-like protein
MRVIAPPHLPVEDGPADRLMLRDGSVGVIRSTGPTDYDDVRRFFQDLSPESRWKRFFTAGEPPDAVVDRLCDSSDPTRGVTLVVVRSVDGQQRLIAVASYLRVNDSIAEVAFAVDDRFQGKGIATGLLERLAVLAAKAGFERFQATTLLENAAMLQVFRDSGFMIRSKSAGGCIEVELSLTPSSESVTSAEERERRATAASIRPLLQPQAVAVVGVSRDRSSLGRRIFDAIVAGYVGPAYPVNLHASDIDGVQAYRSLRDVPAGVDLAVVAVPRDAVLGIIDDCAAAGVKSVVVITAGFAEADDHGRELQRQLVEKVRSCGMRMVGPNCMGVLNTSSHLNASFSPLFPPNGRVAFSSQSGALGMTILALAAERHVGLSTFVSVGNKADVSGNDLLQYWETDPATSVILLYLESFGNPRRFARLARRIGRKKPIVAVKAGRTRAGSQAAGSHTAALAASEGAVDALFRQAGVIRADTIDEMFDVAACLDAQPLPPGTRVAIVTSAGGPGILAVDACVAAGLTVVEFSPATRERLAGFLPGVATLANPVDMVASAGPDEYRQAIQVALAAEETDALIIIYTPVDVSRSAAILAAVRSGITAGRKAGATNKPILACLMAEAGRPLPFDVDGERIPTYAYPENAARALAKVATYTRWRTAQPGLFWSFNDLRADEGRSVCRAIVEARGNDWLTAEEMRRVLSAFGLPLAPGVLAHTVDEAAALASVIGFPVVAKLSAWHLVHKSDVGGVRLNLSTEQAVRKAFNELVACARKSGVADTRDGVLIQPMIGDAVEMMVGLVEDPLFGPMVGVGLGGVHVESLGDVHFRVAPLTDRDAEEVLHEIRGFPLLEGYRGRPRADIDALNEIVLRVSRLAEELPEVVELDLNPVMVLAAGKGCRIVDARVKVGPRRQAGAAPVAPAGASAVSPARQR